MGAAEAVNNAHYAAVMPSEVNVGRMKCNFNLCYSSISFWVEQNIDIFNWYKHFTVTAS